LAIPPCISARVWRNAGRFAAATHHFGIAGVVGWAVPTTIFGIPPATCFLIWSEANGRSSAWKFPLLPPQEPVCTSVSGPPRRKEAGDCVVLEIVAVSRHVFVKCVNLPPVRSPYSGSPGTTFSVGHSLGCFGHCQTSPFPRRTRRYLVRPSTLQTGAFLKDGRSSMFRR